MSWYRTAGRLSHQYDTNTFHRRQLQVEKEQDEQMMAAMQNVKMRDYLEVIKICMTYQ